MDTRIDVICTRLQRHDRIQVLGAIPVPLLVELAVIPYRDHRAGTGYQHPVSPSALTHLVQDLAAGRVDLPRPILLNLRELAGTELSDERGARARFTPGESALHVIDGQTRVEALRRLIEQDPETWSAREVPFSCILGAPEQEELEYFLFVQASKGMATDLAAQELRRAGSEVALPGEPAWVAPAQSLAGRLAERAPWLGRVKFAGQPRGQTTINADSFASSIRPVLRSTFFSELRRADQARVLEAYWLAIAELLPQAFAEPQDFALQKTTGAYALHTLLPSVIERVRSEGNSPSDPAAYLEILRPTLDALEGQTTAGGVARGLDFWRSGPDGAAGAFSSDAGRRALAARLRDALPTLRA